MNNSEITREHDAGVAEIVGYTLWEAQRGKYLMQYVARPGVDMNAKIKGNPYTQLDWDSYKDGNVDVKEPKFTTAPTYESDGIVLEWAKENLGEQWEEFWHSLVRLADERTEEDVYDLVRAGSEDEVLSFFLRYYKPGDYARALLEIIPTPHKEFER